MANIDPLTEEFLIRECSVDNALFSAGRKRRIARKIYRGLKAAFFGMY